MGKNVIWQEWRHKCERSLGEAPLVSISQEYGGLRQALLACRPTHTFKRWRLELSKYNGSKTMYLYRYIQGMQRGSWQAVEE